MKNLKLNWDGEIITYLNCDLDGMIKDWQSQGGIFVEDMTFDVVKETDTEVEYKATLNI